MLKTAAYHTPIYVGLLQLQNASVGVIHGGGDRVRDPALKHQAHALGLKGASIEAEGPGVDVRQNVARVEGDVADTKQSGILDAIVKVGDLEFVIPGTLRQRNLVVMRILQQGLAIDHGHARTGFAEVRRSRIETLTGTGVGFAGSVAILDNGIGRQVPIDDRRGTERIGSVAQKLNVLRFATKLKIEKVANREAVGIRHRHRFQSLSLIHI